jgi:hypothetical protein
MNETKPIYGALRLTRTQMLERLTDRYAVAQWSSDEHMRIAEALGTATDRFHTEDVEAFEEWADQTLVDAALLLLVLEGRVTVRMTADDAQPEFVLTTADHRVPRARIEHRLTVQPVPQEGEDT